MSVTAPYIAGMPLANVTPETVNSIFTGTGALMLAGTLLFLMIKHRVVRLVAVDSGSEWIRALWGVEQYHKRGSKKGRLVRLGPGRHLLIRGMYDGWEVCTRQIPLVEKDLEQPFRGKMLKFGRITVNYRVIFDNTPEGDAYMLRHFLAVRNLDRDNQQSESLDDMVLAITLGALGELLSHTEVDPYGMPIISTAAWIEKTRDRLGESYGSEIVSIDVTSPVWLQGQLQHDGLIRAFGTHSELADVVQLPTFTQPA